MGFATVHFQSPEHLAVVLHELNIL